MRHLMLLLLALTVAPFAVSAAFSAGDPAQGGAPDHHASAYATCAQACSNCQRACDSCATHCAQLLAQGKKEHLKTLQTCQDCATHCTAAAAIVARMGPFADIMCKACAAACARCAEACAKYPDDSHMKQCTEECRRCEKACKEMLQHLGSGATAK